MENILILHTNMHILHMQQGFHSVIMGSPSTATYSKNAYKNAEREKYGTAIGNDVKKWREKKCHYLVSMCVTLYANIFRTNALHERCIRCSVMLTTTRFGIPIAYLSMDVYCDRIRAISIHG